MLRKDDPEHALKRGAVSPVARPRGIREPRVAVFEHNARTNLAALLERGPDAADLNANFAAPVAAQYLIDLLGLRGVEVDEVRRWSHAFIATTGNLADDLQLWAHPTDPTGGREPVAGRPARASDRRRQPG